jgi:hypothetical protein
MVKNRKRLDFGELGIYFSEILFFKIIMPPDLSDKIEVLSELELCPVSIP